MRETSITDSVDNVKTIKKLVSVRERLLEAVTNLCQAIVKSKWKNERAKNNNAYVPTMREHIANIVTHGFIVIPSVWLSYSMILNATGYHIDILILINVN